MSEKMSQSNSEKQPTTFLVTRSNGEIQPGRVTNRSRIVNTLQRNGTRIDVTLREIEFPKIIGPDGKVSVPTKMISEHLLTNEHQAALAEQLHDGLISTEPEVSPKDAELNDYDDLFSDSYDESNYSNESAANRNLDTESRRQEMLEYADVALSGAMRNDNDLPNVIESAFAQAGMRLPSEKTDLINVMRSDARVRVALQDYLREKAEYYRSELPEGVRMNRDKRPNYPGGVPQPSLDVASQYAVSMITGEWDQAREDGTSDVDAVGNVVVGQHRAAARMILMAPAMARRGQNEQ